MKLFRQVLILLALAVLGALVWHWLALDPGYVLVTFRGWSVESTLVVAIALGIVIGLLLRMLLWLLRAPFVGWRRRQRRIARGRLADGLMALEDGRWVQADRLLGKAAREESLRVPALLAAHRAAHARGQTERAIGLLAEAGMAGGQTQARLINVEHLIERGQFASAAELLEHAAVNDNLSPRGLELRVQALVGAGRAAEALDLLPALRASKIREGEALLKLEAHAIAAALLQTEGLGVLLARWKGLSKPQRKQAELIDAFARRAAMLGDADEAAAAIERALNKDWSETLARRYGELAHSDRSQAIRRAESWLAEHPGSPGIQLTLGNLCRAEQLWGKAEDYLLRALGGDVDAHVWEAMGELYAQQADDARARQAFANAVRASRGEACESVRRIHRIALEVTAYEERSSMGVPRLPAS
ncbi:MAG: heme biosynthesis protein HemY [Pseudomarimonas sp.]